LACYSEFHWSYQDVELLPADEAELLSIFFEEEGAHQYRERKKHESTSPASNNSQSERVELELGGDDEIDASDPEYWLED